MECSADFNRAEGFFMRSKHILDRDPDPGTQVNADPCGSGSSTLKVTVFYGKLCCGSASSWCIFGSLFSLWCRSWIRIHFWDADPHPMLLTINAPLIMNMREIIFFLRANYIMGHFKGYFEGAKTFLTPILRVKKVEAPSKYPEKWPIM